MTAGLENRVVRIACRCSWVRLARLTGISTTEHRPHVLVSIPSCVGPLRTRLAEMLLQLVVHVLDPRLQVDLCGRQVAVSQDGLNLWQS